MLITQIQKNSVAPKFTSIAIIKSDDIIGDDYEARKFIKDKYNVELESSPLPKYCKSKLKQELFQDDFNFDNIFKNDDLKQKIKKEYGEPLQIIATGDDIKPVKKAVHDVYKFGNILDNLKRLNNNYLVKKKSEPTLLDYNSIQKRYELDTLPIEKNVDFALTMHKKFKLALKHPKKIKKTIKNAQKGFKYLTERVADLPMYTLEEFKEAVTNGKIKI